MAFQTKENYLKNMYMIDEEMGVVSLSELSKRMHVSIPTVNSMVKKLHREGWVLYEKYQPVKLTDKGKKEAGLIIRKHRIIEMFLVEKMNFGWEEVHDIAEQMEHVSSDALFERMNEMLGGPAFDPHGSPIPDREGTMQPSHYFKLSDMKEKDRVIVCALHDDDNDFLKYLNHKKMALGTEITIEHIEPFDKSMTVTYNKPETKETLSHEVCEKLLVKPS